MTIEEYNNSERAKLEKQSIERYISGERRPVKSRKDRKVELDPKRFEPVRLPGELEPIAVSAQTGEPLNFEDCDELSKEGRGVWLLGSSPPDKKDCKGARIFEVTGVFGEQRFFMITDRPGTKGLKEVLNEQRKEDDSAGNQRENEASPRLEEK
jgi:hypothetical protein